MHATIAEGGAMVHIHWPDGHAVRFHAEWLRDNAADPETRSPLNGQRLVTLADIPADVQVVDVQVVDAHADGTTLRLRFSDRPQPVDYEARWLLEHSYDRAPAPAPGWLPADIETWDGRLGAQLPDARYDAVHSHPDALLQWLEHVRRLGFARLTGGPADAGTVTGIAALFGYVRQTNYGRLFDVRSEARPNNLAYTTLGLAVHTDNPYRDPPPTLQILHCIAAGPTGGDSLVVDGFRAAQVLRDETPDAFELLSRYCARFEYCGADDDVFLSARRPVIELAPDGELLAISMNNRSIAPIVDVPFEHMRAYYRACRQFESVLARADLTVHFRLAPGDSFIVDNTRVLHGRSGFDGGGERWLQGCYADRDGLLSTLRVLRRAARQPAR